MAKGINQVHEQVYISNITAAREHPKDGIDSVVSVCQDSVKDNVGCEYWHFNMSDGPDNRYGGDSSYEMFETAAEKVLSLIRFKDTVLVHCHAGQSRSASTSIAALGVHMEEDYYTVYDMVKEKRPQIHPDGLLEQHAQRFIEERTDISHTPIEVDGE